MIVQPGMQTIRTEVWDSKRDEWGEKVPFEFRFPDLLKFVRLDEFKPEWARFFDRPVEFADTFLPTEMVFREPSHAVPQRGRIYGTDFYVFKGKIVTYDWLQRLYTIVLGERFPGTFACADQLLMAEVYHDIGSDGHTEYRMCGFRFITGKYLDDHTGPGGMLACMHFGHGDDWDA